jgi:hypothetical protein
METLHEKHESIPRTEINRQNENLKVDAWKYQTNKRAAPNLQKAKVPKK